MNPIERSAARLTPVPSTKFENDKSRDQPGNDTQCILSGRSDLPACRYDTYCRKSVWASDARLSLQCGMHHSVDATPLSIDVRASVEQARDRPDSFCRLRGDPDDSCCMLSLPPPARVLREWYGNRCRLSLRAESGR